jgi:hypothetical protein
MIPSAESIRVMRPLFQAGEGGSIPTSALQLVLEPLEFEAALRLNECWHSRLPRMGTGFIRNQPFLCYGAHYQGRIYAVAIWSNPVGRNLPQRAWLELRRLAVAPDRPRNTCSRILRVMALLIGKERQHVENLISYQDLGVHSGTIYRAAGWTPTAVNKDGNWTRRKRARPTAQSVCPKQRWEKRLRPSPSCEVD